MRERTIKAARHHGILERLQQLEAELLKLTYVKDVDFDILTIRQYPKEVYVLFLEIQKNHILS